MSDELVSQQSPEPEPSAAALSRRRALQAALGVGVAAAAWSLPQVVAVAQVPFPGGVCTLPLKNQLVLFSKNVKCSADCTLNGVTYVTFLDDTSVSGDVSIDFIPRPASTPPAGTDGCSAPPGAPYTITTSGSFAGFVCVIKSVVFKNQGTFPASSGLSPIVPQGGGNLCNDFVTGVNLSCCPSSGFHPS